MMNKVLGLFDYFPNLNKAPVDEIAKRFPSRINIKLIENYIANRILYPQAIPTNKEELKGDLNLLTVALSLHPKDFYNPDSKKIYIPQDFTYYLGDIRRIAYCFIDAFKPDQITRIYVKSGLIKNIGSIIRPTKIKSAGVVTVWINEPPFLSDQKYQLNLGKIYHLEAGSERFDIKFQSSVATLMGKVEIELELFGGSLGLIIDLR